MSCSKASLEYPMHNHSCVITGETPKSSPACTFHKSTWRTILQSLCGMNAAPSAQACSKTPDGQAHKLWSGFHYLLVTIWPCRLTWKSGHLTVVNKHKPECLEIWRTFQVLPQAVYPWASKKESLLRLNLRQPCVPSHEFQIYWRRSLTGNPEGSLRDWVQNPWVTPAARTS